MKINTSSCIYPIKTKTTHPTIKFNDSFLHSLYAPIKEEKNNILLHLEELRKSPRILILGLGLGYHVDEIFKITLSAFKNCKIIVLEFIDEIYTCAKDLNYNNLFNNNHVSIIREDLENIFNNSSILHFIEMIPYIYIHRPSYKLYESFFPELSSRTIENAVLMNAFTAISGGLKA